MRSSGTARNSQLRLQPRKSAVETIKLWSFQTVRLVVDQYVSQWGGAKSPRPMLCTANNSGRKNPACRHRFYRVKLASKSTKTNLWIKINQNPITSTRQHSTLVVCQLLRGGTHTHGRCQKQPALPFHWVALKYSNHSGSFSSLSLRTINPLNVTLCHPGLTAC